jgi:hypothetical protein
MEQVGNLIISVWGRSFGVFVVCCEGVEGLGNGKQHSQQERPGS